MPDLGLNVLLKGKNMARLLGGLWAVSYTHLDVYKRQVLHLPKGKKVA